MLVEDFSKRLDSIPKFNNCGEKITIVAASKMVAIDEINKAFSAGIIDFGENKVQELKEKYNSFPPATLHFIGHLQTNKIKDVVGKVSLIQSVDSEKLLIAIADFADRHNLTQQVLLEVNPAKDENKSGFSCDEVFGIYQKYHFAKGISIKGLMAMFPKNSDKSSLISYCKAMRNIFDEMKLNDENICFLSMGMSDDFPTAIKNGSNMIRMGRYFFGERKYK